MFKKTHHQLLIIIACMICMGCGNSGPRYVDIEGTVTLDGTPLPNIRLAFTPTDRSSGNGSGGYSDENGKYKLKAIVSGATRDIDGIIPGKYRVTILGSVAIDGQERENTEQSGAAYSPVSHNNKPRVPPVYTSKKSPLIVTIPDAGGVIDVKLLSSPLK